MSFYVSRPILTICPSSSYTNNMVDPRLNQLSVLTANLSSPAYHLALSLRSGLEKPQSYSQFRNLDSYLVILGRPTDPQQSIHIARMPLYLSCRLKPDLSQNWAFPARLTSGLLHVLYG